MRRLAASRKRPSLVYFLYISFLLWALYYLLSLRTVDDGYEAPVILYLPELKDKLCCYFTIENDELPSAEDPRFSPGEKAIFFHDTSCRGGIDSRQACAVESAARMHPNWQINLMFSSPVTEKTLRKSILAKLLQFKNIKLARVHIERYGKGTPVDSILAHSLKKSSDPIERVTDILRILTLHKFGGVYLDTEGIVIRSFDTLPDNWIAKETETELSIGAMAFTSDGIGTSVTRAMLKEIHDNYNPEVWTYKGPKSISRVLNKICPNMLETASDCGGVKILSSELLYPIHFERRFVYFENGSIDDSTNGIYMHHMWHYLTKGLKIEKDSPYVKLARKYCPTIYKMYGDRFGD
ncbi:lactosylceramide 4-alpha-galactosyltransferase-like [Anticarsia gemmatalis]|uniref:lactosylceramide 4-alpha-galactosyltransferase-like n=1 Tax=Anticarsia gemmatalis TaxID=129554 RepID=UPI003F76D2AC